MVADARRLTVRSEKSGFAGDGRGCWPEILPRRLAAGPEICLRGREAASIFKRRGVRPHLP